MQSYRLVIVTCMEVTIVEIEQQVKCYNEDSFGPPNINILVNLLKVVMHVNEWVINAY
jgi:hypothetical protein